MLKPAPRCSRTDDGFTLIEVLISVMLLGVVMGALAMAAIVFMKNMSETQARLYVSNSRTFASRYLVGDIQSSAVYADNDVAVSVGTVPPGVTAASLPTASIVANTVTACDTGVPAASINGYGIYTTGANAPRDRLFRLDYTLVDPDGPAGDEGCTLVRTKYEWDDPTPPAAPTLAAVESVTVARDLLVDGATPPVVFTADANGKWQVTIRLLPKSSQAVDYDYQVWSKPRVTSILP